MKGNNNTINSIEMNLLVKTSSNQRTSSNNNSPRNPEKNNTETSSDLNSSDHHKERDKFGSHYEYLVSVLGFAAGFGSVWRFPYLVFKNGGGVFMIPYFVLLFLIGVPAFYFETSLGQMFQKGPPKIYEKLNKKWKGLGVFPVLLTLSMGTYYNLILAYSIYYLWKSFSFPLPWALSDIETHAEPWNKDYFYKDFLNSSSGIGEIGNIVWPIFLCYLISQVIVYLCVSKGVQLSGKVALFTATSPYVLLFILMIRGLFLDGAWSGIQYLFTPDWSKIFHLQVWVDAANQVAFQVSTGCAVLVFFGSYRPVNQEIKQTSVVIPFLTIVCGFLASFVIFGFMGYLSHLSQIPISEIPLAGPDLAFVVFPAVLTLMPWSNLLSLTFFLTMVFLGIDTQFAYVDCLAGSIEDEFNGGPVKFLGKIIPMPIVRMLICILISFAGFLFCSQGGFYYLGFADSYAVGSNLIIGVFIETFFFTWVEKWDRIEEQILVNIGDGTPEIVVKLLKYSVPVITGILGSLGIILQLTHIGDQPWWCSMIGWFYTLYPYAPIVYYYLKYKDEKVMPQELEGVKQELIVRTK